MIQHVHAIYDHGVLRPLAPLNLQDKDEVVLTVEKANRDGTESAFTTTLFDVLANVGLVGSIKDAPIDLSSNPERMKGFGASDK
jgi:predicted DNA-binding antitoxin AbrB/MazE fold protein